MANVITAETVVALSQCPRKAHLLLHSPDQGSAHPYHAILDRHAEETRERYLTDLAQAHPEAVPGDQTSFADRKPVLIRANLQSGNLQAFADALTRASTPSAARKTTYEPVLVVGTYTVTADQKLALAFTSNSLNAAGRGEWLGDQAILFLYIAINIPFEQCSVRQAEPASLSSSPLSRVTLLSRQRLVPSIVD